MKVTIDRAALLAAMNQCGAVVSKKSPHFAANAIMLETIAGRGMTVRATDCVSASIRVTLANVSHDGPGSLLLSARDAIERVKAMPDGSEVTLATKDDSVAVTAKGARRFTLRTLPAAEMPAWGETVGTPMALSGAAVAKALAGIEHAMCSDEARITQNGAMLEFANGILTAKATDEHRIAMASVPVECSGKPVEMFLGFRTVGILRKLIAGVDLVTITPGDRTVFRTDTVEFATQLMQSRFPPVQLVFERVKAGATVEAPRKALVEAFQSAALAHGNASISLAEDSLVVTAVDSDNGEEAQDRVVATVTGKSQPTSVSCQYMLDALNAIQADVVAIAMGPSWNDMVTVTNEGTRLLVMPKDPNCK